MLRTAVDAGWGAPNPEIARLERRALLACRRKPSLLIQDVAGMGHSPDPARVAALLNAAGIDFVLIGAHALAVHTRQPRATMDVDVVVADVAAAVRALRRIKRGTKVVTLGPEIGERITDAAGIELVDVLHPSGGVRGALFRHRLAVTVRGQPLHVPSLAAMLALKWLAMFSPTRSLAKRSIDKGDFLNLIDAHPDLDMRPAARLVNDAQPLLAQQLVYDVAEYRRSGVLRLYDE